MVTVTRNINVFTFACICCVTVLLILQFHEYILQLLAVKCVDEIPVNTIICKYREEFDHSIGYCCVHELLKREG